MRAAQEHFLSGLCHLFNPVPLLGLLFSAGVWFHAREESRAVVRHARQAMLFHSLLLLLLLAWCVVGFFCSVIRVLSPSLAHVLSMLNSAAAFLLYTAYLGICLLGFYRCSAGSRFVYPLIGGRR